ncbi:hypothetical protein PTKIN_Ptkin13bG0025800 [Pterospermum kingtungense]
MMNVLALSLVVSSLAAAGVWSPAPQREDVIVKEGHRVVVVEYDEDGKQNTKVSISSPPGEYFSKETIEEAASAPPNLGQGISPQGKHGPGTHLPGELICDAFGKCTSSIATAFGKAKDKVSDTAHEAQDKVVETAYEAKDKVAETAHEAGEKVSETAHVVKDKVSETAHEAKEKVASPKRWVSHETAQQTKGAVGDALGKAKEAVARKGQDVKENAKETAKSIGDHIVSNISEVENAREKAMKEAKENTERVASKAKTRANKLFDGLKYLTRMEALNSVMGIANLLGLATAYGMSVWVTFISSYVLAGVLPRQQFGVVQSKMYPVYFRAMAYSIGSALLGHLLGSSNKSHMFQAFNLLSSLVMVLFNAMYLEPKATKVMFERMKMEKEEGRGRDDLVAEPPSVTNSAATKTKETPSPEQEVVMNRIARLNERLKKLNTKSSLLNVLTLMALTWHLVYLGQRLNFNC